MRVASFFPFCCLIYNHFFPPYTIPPHHHVEHFLRVFCLLLKQEILLVFIYLFYIITLCMCIKVTESKICALKLEKSNLCGCKINQALLAGRYSPSWKIHMIPPHSTYLLPFVFCEFKVIFNGRMDTLIEPTVSFEVACNK